MSAIGTAQAALVAQLVAAGIPATADPASVVPPIVWVAAPSEVSRPVVGSNDLRVSWVLFAVGPPPGNFDGFEAAYDLLEQVTAEIPLPHQWEVATVSPNQINMPAYRVTVPDTVTLA